MALDAKFKRGTPRWEDYIPDADYTAGHVVDIGTSCLVLHSPGVTGVLMGAAAEGGVYQMTLGATLAAHAEVDFNTTTRRLVAAGTGNAYFGRIEAGNGGGDGDKRYVVHQAARKTS